MKILLGSTNPSKKRALIKALEALEITDYEIICYKVNSDVPSKPVGYEILRGADNRNQQLKFIAQNIGIEYDYLCSIEGGYTIDEIGHPYIETYVIIENKSGRKSTGKSLGLRISKEMFRCIQAGVSLNSLIEKITTSENNKQNNGITGYLSSGLFKREEVDEKAIESAFISLLFEKERKELDEQIKLLLQK